MEFIKKHYYWLVIAVTLLICWFSWPIISNFTSKEIQPIASAASTLSGILSGFVMASITLFASAKDNKFVRNTTMTGYLPKLVNRLHVTMGLLLMVCFTFLLVLFIPDSLTFKVGNTSYRYSVLIVSFGMISMLNAFFQFYLSWKGFKEFSKYM